LIQPWAETGLAGLIQNTLRGSANVALKSKVVKFTLQ